MTVQLIHGDCLQEMGSIEDGSVDLILCDLPFGTTAIEWDTIIPCVPLWTQYRRVLKQNGVVLLFGSQPFTSLLIGSNLEWFKYSLVWRKSRPSGFLHSKNKPLKAHEDISVFSPGTAVHASQSPLRMTYNPQMSEGKPYRKFSRKEVQMKWGNQIRKGSTDTLTINSGERYPTTVIDCPNDNHKSLHPTQKPVALMEYLIRTYTNEGETVLDNCSGSGTTGVAAIRTGRNAILIEKDETYFCVGAKRIAETQAQTALEIV